MSNAPQDPSLKQPRCEMTLFMRKYPNIARFVMFFDHILPFHPVSHRRVESHDVKPSSEPVTQTATMSNAPPDPSLKQPRCQILQVLQAYKRTVTSVN